MKLPEGDLYVSSVEGHIVGRPGSGSPTTKPQWIGAYTKTRTRSDGSIEFDGVEWRTDEVHRIPESDVQTHLKSYLTELSAGGLALRTKDEFEAFCEAQAEASAKDAEPKVTVVKGTPGETDGDGTGPMESAGGFEPPRGDEVALDPPEPAEKAELVDVGAEQPPADKPVKARRRGAGSE